MHPPTHTHLVLTIGAEEDGVSVVDRKPLGLAQDRLDHEIMRHRLAVLR